MILLFMTASSLPPVPTKHCSPVTWMYWGLFSAGKLNAEAEYLSCTNPNLEEQTAANKTNLPDILVMFWSQSCQAGCREADCTELKLHRHVAVHCKPHPTFSKEVQMFESFCSVHTCTLLLPAEDAYGPSMFLVQSLKQTKRLLVKPLSSLKTTASLRTPLCTLVFPAISFNPTAFCQLPLECPLIRDMPCMYQQRIHPWI